MIELAREIAPTDELTGVPLPIMPRDDDVLMLMRRPELNAARQEVGDEFADVHHHYNPRKAPELSDPGGWAVRDSSVQVLMRPIHNRAHHVYAGPPLPQTDTERFRKVLFGVARYVPRRAIDLDGDSPNVIDLSDVQIKRLQTSGELRPMKDRNINDFLHRYILANPTTAHISPGMIDEFLSLQNGDEITTKRRASLAHQLLMQVIEPAVEPLHDTFKLARQERLLQPVPDFGPREAVRDMLLGQGRLRRVYSLRRIGNVLFKALSEQQGLVMAS